jgi:probable phosphoglycerate mutase
VLVVTHGWVMDVVARHVQGLPRGAVLRRKPKNIEQLWLDASADSIRARGSGASAALPAGGGG